MNSNNYYELNHVISKYLDGGATEADANATVYLFQWTEWPYMAEYLQLLVLLFTSYIRGIKIIELI